MHKINLNRIIILLLVAAVIYFPCFSHADENLALYGLKGYAYTYSPLIVDGLHLQAGTMYSKYEERNLTCRDGYIWAVPVSLTYGDGNWWEAAFATHFEYWKNTDFDVNESGTGDVFLGGKARLLGQDRGTAFDLSLMPYMFFSTGNRDKSIGDLYLYNPTEDEDISYGLNLLIGRQWKRFYLSGNLGINYVNTDLDYIDSTTIFAGLALEYQISENMTSYVEFMNNENKNHFQYPPFHPCRDEDIDDDIREIGLGFVWIKDKWGVKVHGGAGLTETSPDFRVMGLVNRNMAF